MQRKKRFVDEVSSEMQGCAAMEESSIFTQFIKKRKNLIKNKKILQTTYIPEVLPHRASQINKIASIISIALSGDKPSNIMIYGKTGTGKTAVMNYIGKELKKVDPDQDKCIFIYVNCEIVDTAYGILYNIATQFINDISQKIPFTGWGFEKLYVEMVNYIDEMQRVFIIVLDEIDNMVANKGDQIFYYLAKINENLFKSKVSLVGISNNMKFFNLLEPKARSRFGGETLIFPPYTKKELEDILTERADNAFDEGILDGNVIPYCATLAARVDGDARMALDLMRVAADIAERNGDESITQAHVISAKNSIEFDALAEATRTLSPQSKLVLMSIIKNSEDDNKRMITGDIYSTYKELSEILGTSVLTPRRVTDLISELDMMGIINAQIKSFGKAGRTREIELGIPKDVIALFKTDPFFKALELSKPPSQTRLI